MQVAPFDSSGAVHYPQRWPLRLLAPLTKRSHRNPAVDCSGSPRHANEPPTPPVYTQAAVLVLYMARNATLAVAMAWGFNFLVSLGNVLSGLAPQDQSLASFTAACTAWTSLMIAGAVVSQLGASFMPLHFVSRLHQQPTWWRAMGSLIYRTFPWLVVSFALAVGSWYAFGRCSPRVQRWKLHFYVGGFLINTITIRVLQTARRMYQLETVEGLARGVVDHKPFWRRLHAAYSANMPMILSIYTAAAYVHGASQLHLHTSFELFAFSAVSLVVKLAAQEAAMHAVMRQPRSQVNRMYVSIAVPTVLIDTQVRILLLRATIAGRQSDALRFVHLWGSVLLAVAEVVLRLGKIWWLRATIHRRREATRSTDKVGEIPERLEAEFESWRTRRLRFHGAEAQADMYAEYIAIGCSLSIYFFYHAHPKYKLAVEGEVTSPIATPANGVFSASYVQVVVFQVALELAIDFVCCLVELAAGVPCTVPRGSRAFVATLFITCAVGNVAISSAMYLVNDDGQ